MQKLYSLNKKKHNILFCSEYITQPKYNEVWTSYTLFILTYFWLLVKKYHQKNSLITDAAIIVYTKKYTVYIFSLSLYLRITQPKYNELQTLLYLRGQKTMSLQNIIFLLINISSSFFDLFVMLLSIKIKQTNNIMLYH